METKYSEPDRKKKQKHRRRERSKTIHP